MLPNRNHYILRIVFLYKNLNQKFQYGSRRAPDPWKYVLGAKERMHADLANVWTIKSEESLMALDIFIIKNKLLKTLKENYK